MWPYSCIQSDTLLTFCNKSIWKNQSHKLRLEGDCNTCFRFVLVVHNNSGIGLGVICLYIINLSIEYLLTKAVSGWQCGARPASARKCQHHHYVIWDHCHQTGSRDLARTHPTCLLDRQFPKLLFWTGILKILAKTLTGRFKITNVHHRMRNQQISLYSLGTTPSPGIDGIHENHSRGAFCTCK